MAYAKRKLKKKTTKKRSTMKRKAPKARVTSRGRKQGPAEHRMTGYARALQDPKDGPLVGVPQFVPIDTHRVRVRAVGTIQTGGTDSARIFFNPARMVARNTYPIQYGTGIGTARVATESALDSFNSNSAHVNADFQATSAGAMDTINNGDGIKARVVGAMIRVCNVSAATTRGGVFTALHEPHHKTLEDFTLDDLSKNMKSIIRPAGDGGYISLLYRPVKPEEVEEWQISPYGLPGQSHRTASTVANTTAGDVDGTTRDAYPGYMCIDYQGAEGTTLHVEAYAIIEYAGESLTTLSRPIGAGGGKSAEPKHIRPSVDDAAATEQLQGIGTQ